MISNKILLLPTVFFCLISFQPVQASLVLTGKFGWNDDLDPSTLDTSNIVQLLPYGYTSNTTLSAAELTFEADFGGGSVANFTISQSWDTSNVRQFGGGMEGAGSPTSNRDGELAITLNSLTNIPVLILDGVELNSAVSGDPVVVAPNGTFATSSFSTFGSTWNVGERLVFTHTAQNTGLWFNSGNMSDDEYNVEAIQLTAVPEPTTLVSLLLMGIAAFFVRRRARAC